MRCTQEVEGSDTVLVVLSDAQYIETLSPESHVVLCVCPLVE